VPHRLAVLLDATVDQLKIHGATGHSEIPEELRGKFLEA
jgi:hypothetical protein